MQKIIGRLGLAFVFLSFGIWELVNPSIWTSFVPDFMGKIMASDLLVIFHGVVLCVLGLALLLSFMPKLALLFSSLVLLEIVISILFTDGFTQTFVRDIGLLALSLSLLFGELSNKKEVVVQSE